MNKIHTHKLILTLLLIFINFINKFLCKFPALYLDLVTQQGEKKKVLNVKTKLKQKSPYNRHTFVFIMIVTYH